MANTTFTQEEQTEIVRMAATLEIAIEDEQKELARLKTEKFKNAPQRPVKQKISPNIQPIAPDYSSLPKVNVTFEQYLENQCNVDHTILNKIYGHEPIKRGFLIAAGAAVLWFISLITVATSGSGKLILLFGPIIAIAAIPLAFSYNSNYRNKYEALRAGLEQQMMSDPSYIQARLELERKAQEATQKAQQLRDQQIAEYEAKFANEIEDYETRIIPQYNLAKKNWEYKHDLKVKMLESDLVSNKQKLSNLYNQTKLISTHFREIYQLVWIYEEMSSSQHDLDAAIQLLNDDTTHNLLRGIISDVNSMHSDMLQGMHSIYMQLDAINNKAEITNEILDEMSDNLRRTRRDMNIGNIVGTYQRHKFRKEFNEFRKQFV